jgi:hypothetical protein
MFRDVRPAAHRLSRRSALPLTVLALFACCWTATSAAARTPTKFSVVTLTKSSHRSGHTIITHGQLVSPNDRKEVVGHYVAKFGILAGNRVSAQIVFDFADGSLTVKGVFGPHDNVLTVTGGSGRWKGASGRTKMYDAGQGAERYSFTIVRT